MWDTDGKKYLDFSAGIAVNALGHAHEGMLRVLTEQASKLLHTSNVYHNEWAAKLAQLLVKLTKSDGGLGFASNSDSTSSSDGLKIFFSNSGTEANEGALKIARKVGKDRGGKEKHRIACFQNSFHGRSMGALSVTTNPKYQEPFTPLIPGIDIGTINDIGGLNGLVKEDTCAVIVEPVQGEGGIHAASLEWLRALRARCNEVGAVLIFDEIQVGGCIMIYAQVPRTYSPLRASSVDSTGRVRFGLIRRCLMTAILTWSQWLSRSPTAIPSGLL